MPIAAERGEFRGLDHRRYGTSLSVAPLPASAEEAA